jgi:hypothetical protein
MMAQVRLYAVHSLGSVTDELLMDFLLQLVQTVKYEANHDNPVTRFLLSRALRCPKYIGQRTYTRPLRPNSSLLRLFSVDGRFL